MFHKLAAVQKMLTFDFCEKPGKSFSGSKHAAGGIRNQDPQKRGKFEEKYLDLDFIQEKYFEM